ncbi:MAG: NADPH-dependent F420 reductase [Deltaproteobacteria bacterium]|nr:NADPH-dependent F420 reductase [Deltaproteobacteria bacterium]
MGRIAFIGGTGPEGMGLALRCALAGESVIIGSRQQARAEAAAEKERYRLHLLRPGAHIEGCENAAAADRAEIVAMCVPFAGLEHTLHELRPQLAGKIILDVVNPLQVRHGVFKLEPVPAGSVGELTQQMVPQAHVVSAFKNLSAEELLHLHHPLAGDVILCGDHDQSKQQIVDLVHRMPNLRPIDAGSLVNSRRLESITALLLNLNRRYHAITSIQIIGLKI